MGVDLAWVKDMKGYLLARVKSVYTMYCSTSSALWR